MNQKSVLSWTLAEYQQHNEEAPDRILENPHMCEGDLMSDEELDEYLHDSIATIKILIDSKSPKADKLTEMYLADLDFLVSLGRLDVSDYNEMSKPEHFSY
jgi:hypothetical protein